jgi:hypothetical protein
MKKIWKIIIGIILIIFSLYLIYSSYNMPTYSSQEILLGQGSVFMLWGIRELIGGILNGH